MKGKGPTKILRDSRTFRVTHDVSKVILGFIIQVKEVFCANHEQTISQCWKICACYQGKHCHNSYLSAFYIDTRRNY